MHRKLIGVACSLVVFPLQVSGQYDPGATQMIADGLRDQMMRDEIYRQLLPRPALNQPQATEAEKTRGPDLTPAQMQALRAEYAQRVRREGKTNADAWLRRTAWELGYKAGEAERKHRGSR